MGVMACCEEVSIADQTLPHIPTYHDHGIGAHTRSSTGKYGCLRASTTIPGKMKSHGKCVVVKRSKEGIGRCGAFTRALAR